MLKVKKRNGVVMPFDRERIVKAINKAFIQVDGTLYEEDTANDIADEIKYMVKTADHIMTVEEIQDIIEDFLMKSERRDVAKEYIRYRYKRQMVRDFGEDNFISAFADKVQGADIENQNANVDEKSFGGRTGAASDLSMKRFALEYCVSDMARQNHINNEIYIHDLANYPVGQHNCLTIPFDKLLREGFTTRQTDVRPAGSVSTAFQLLAVIFQLQSLEQFGGVSASHLDWTMVPYVRKSFHKHFKDGIKYVERDNEFVTNLIHNGKDLGYENKSITDCFYTEHEQAYEYAMEMTQKEVHQAVEAMYHNLK